MTGSETKSKREDHRLSKVLLAKAAFDAFFVCALIATFYFATFNADVKGQVSSPDESNHITGWVVSASAASDRIEVQLYLDNQFVAHEIAVCNHQGVTRVGGTSEAQCRFSFKLPPLASGEHEARVYLVSEGASNTRRTLQQIGSPLVWYVQRSFINNAGGSDINTEC